MIKDNGKQTVIYQMFDRHRRTKGGAYSIRLLRTEMPRTMIPCKRDLWGIRTSNDAARNEDLAPKEYIHNVKIKVLQYLHNSEY